MLFIVITDSALHLPFHHPSYFRYFNNLLYTLSDHWHRFMPLISAGAPIANGLAPERCVSEKKTPGYGAYALE
jgi:hypothetical protein